MTWLRRYRIRHYFENAIWIVPSLSILAASAFSVNLYTMPLDVYTGARAAFAVSLLVSAYGAMQDWLHEGHGRTHLLCITFCRKNSAARNIAPITFKPSASFPQPKGRRQCLAKHGLFSPC